MPEKRPAKAAMKWKPQQGKPKKGRPKNTLRRTLQQDINSIGREWEDLEEAAADRGEWRRLAALRSDLRGRT